MVRAIITHTVKSFDEWLPIYNEHEKARAQAGSTGGTVHRGLEDPNEVAVISDWPSVEAFDGFVQRADLKEVMARAGVVGEPRIQLFGDAVPEATDI